MGPLRCSLVCFLITHDPYFSAWSNTVDLTVWYDTKIAKQQPGFQARNVVGGVLIAPLDDKPLADKWLSRSVTK